MEGDVEEIQAKCTPHRMRSEPCRRYGRDGGRCRGDTGEPCTGCAAGPAGSPAEIQARCIRDIGETRVRYRRDIGEIYLQIAQLLALERRRVEPLVCGALKGGRGDAGGLRGEVGEARVVEAREARRQAHQLAQLRLRERAE